MKNLLFGMLAMAAMVSCSSENDPIDDVTGGKQDKVEIKLNAGVVGVETKAQVVPGDDIVSFTNQTVPLFRVDGVGTADWSKVGEAVNATIDGSTVKLGEAHKYYTGDNNAYFIGYYSTIVPTRTTNVLNFDGVDGTKDIICTNETDAGTKASTGANAELTFNHIVSKVLVKVKGTEAAKKAFGKITKIELTGIPTSINVTLGSTLSIAANTTAKEANIVLFEATDGGTELTASEVALGATPIIFNGGTTSPYGTPTNPLKLKVYTAEYIDGLDVDISTISTGLELGKKHTITLTFKDQIGVTSAITGWSDSAQAGEGEVG